MSYTLEVVQPKHDLCILDGRIQAVAGADEVRQHILIALRHNLGEWFINRQAGIPWDPDILGTKNNAQNAFLIIRNAISGVPGVIRVRDTQASFNTVTRALNVSVTCQVMDAVEPVTVETVIFEDLSATDETDQAEEGEDEGGDVTDAGGGVT